MTDHLSSEVERSNYFKYALDNKIKLLQRGIPDMIITYQVGAYPKVCRITYRKKIFMNLARLKVYTVQAFMTVLLQLGKYLLDTNADIN